jgi:hypothetical protein
MVVSVALMLVGVAPASADTPSLTPTVSTTDTTPATPATSTATPTPTPSSTPAVVPTARTAMATATPTPTPTPSTAPPSGPCIDSSKVSYTYDASTNSGAILVPYAPETSGLLCHPFYVTAASWNYTTNAVWPQALNVAQTQKLAKITSTGTYHYSATVTCGQGDIYASFDSQPDPTATLIAPGLAAPGVPFAEHFLHDMGFKGTSPTYVQQSTSCWIPPLTPETGTPTFVTANCTAPAPASKSFAETQTRLALVATGANTVSLPAVPGGVWTWTNNSDSNSASKTGSYAIGASYFGAPQDGFGNYTFTLTDGDAHDTYKVTGTTTTWTPLDASTLCVTPGDPTFAAQTCDGTSGSLVGGSITVDLKTGLVYEIQGGPDNIDIKNVSTATTTGLKPGDYTVSVTNVPGYILDLTGQTSWPVTIPIDAYAGDCTLDTLASWDASVSGTDAVCTSSTTSAGTITLGHTLPDQLGKIDYKILNVATGVTQDLGTVASSVSEAPGDYVVTAKAAGARDGLNPSVQHSVVQPDGSQVFDTITIAAYDGDCLPTLAGFDAGATFAPATCRGSDGTSGTITFVTTEGEVDYTITNLATQVTTDLGTTTSSLKVAAGSYSVAAKVVHTGDTIFEFNAASGTLPTITVAAVTTICSALQTLAFTGVASPGLGLSLAASMLILGLAGLFVRRRYGRSAK